MCCITKIKKGSEFLHIVNDVLNINPIVAKTLLMCLFSKKYYETKHNIDKTQRFARVLILKWIRLHVK